MRSLTIISCAIFVLISSQHAQARIIHVPTDSSTIQGGINGAVSGDTVMVGPGIYTGPGNYDLSIVGKFLTVIGEYGADSTIIDGGGTHDGFSAVSSATQIKGLTIKNAVSGIYCVQTSPTIDSCRIQDFTGYGFVINGTDPPITPVITDCVVDQDDPGLLGTGIGIHLNGYMDITVSRSEVSDCGVGFYVYSPVTFHVTNCDIKGNGIGVYLVSSIHSPTPNGEVNYCNFEGNGQYDFYASTCSDPSTSIDVRFNWWGTDDGYAPAVKVYDHMDNAGSPVVDCSGPLDAPYPTGVVQPDYVSGTLEVDTTLLASGSPYKVNGCYLIKSGTQTTVEAGAEFYFGPGSGLLVEGQLTAIGESSNHILFTSSANTAAGTPVAGSWEELRFETSSEGFLRYCDLSYAKTCANLRPNTDVILSHCDIRRASIHCVLIEASSSRFDTCSIRDFTSYGFVINGTDPPITPVITGCVVDQDDPGLLGTGIGIHLNGYMDITVSRSEVSDCGVGFYVYSPVTLHVTNCDIKGNGIGVYLVSSIHSPTPNGEVNYCNFEGNGQYDFYASTCSDPSTVINAQYNDWGAYDSATIADEHIYDHLDNSSCPYVDFMPFTDTGYICGDVNADGLINSADVVYLINYLFIHGPAPNPLWVGDCNSDGVTNSADVVYLINYLFIGGPPPSC